MLYEKKLKSKEAMFKKILDKLSISSKEAVVDGNFNGFDDFKNYLHIDRYVESRLEKIVISASKNEKPQLILISGNVGDGKSHMMSRLYKNHPTEMASIEVRNDATESNDVGKSWIDELNEFLFPFSDDQLKYPSKKQTKIVAINLGVLSTFLDKSLDGFSALREFVSKKGIIDNLSFDNEFDPNSYFQYINLADYNLFTLTNENTTSDLINKLLTKITAKDDHNPFYIAYKEYFSNHPNQNGCLMRYNFLELGKNNVQLGLANLIMYAIIKFKLIISIRDLLNFVYDLIVPYEYSNLSGTQIKNYTTNTNSLLESSIYNKLFDSAGRSEIFTALKRLDPVKLRSVELDGLIFKLSSTEKPIDIFKDHDLELNNNWVYTLDQKEYLIKTFIRNLFISDIRKFDHELSDYYQYSKYLYYYYKGDKNRLKPLYKDLIKAIFSWNGNSKSDSEIIVQIGKKQLDYNVTQSISITPLIQTQNNNNHADEVHEFETSIIVGIKAEEHEIKFTLDIDLYVLLQNVIKGYSPNKLDRENHTDFEQLVDKLTSLSSRNKPLNFEQINGSLRQRFQLSYDAEFGYEFVKK